MHEQYLEMAMALAADAVRKGKGGPFGAVIVKNGNVIGQGCNRVTVNNDPTAHAEIIAIRDACINLDDFRLSNCTLYSSCEPCPMCAAAIYWARIERVFFTATQSMAAQAGFDDANILQDLSCPPEKRSIPSHQIRLKDSELPFQLWQESQTKIRY